MLCYKMENDKVGGITRGIVAFCICKHVCLVSLSKMCNCAAPLPCQQAIQMLHVQHNTMQTIMVQKVQNKICKIYTMHSLIQNRVRMQIRKLHVIQSTIKHMLHLQLHAVLHVWYNTCISTMHCNRATTSTKATKN